MDAKWTVLSVQREKERRETDAEPPGPQFAAMGFHNSIQTVGGEGCRFMWDPYFIVDNFG